MPRRQSGRPAFTLIELLIVIAIILFVSAIALPAIKSALDNRQIVDGAQLVTSTLAGVRDSAIKDQSIRGIRLLPDPAMTIPSLGNANAGTLQCVYNRFVPIEPAPDYSQGRVNVGPALPLGLNMPGFPPLYPRGVNATDTYPLLPSNAAFPSPVLMVEESPFHGGFAALPGLGIPNEPTNWYWNIRVGDQIQLSGSGRKYTVIGPCTINPWTTGANNGNPEMFVNVGPPGTTPPLVRTYYSTINNSTPATFNALTPYTPEFLFLVDGEDNNQDGYIDNGWNGYNENADLKNFIDELAEWINPVTGVAIEVDQWAIPAAAATILDGGSDGNSPSGSGTSNWMQNSWAEAVQDVTYSISRRPVPTPGAREVALPTGIVIDATGWNTVGQERSRLPVTQGSLWCDIMLDANGLFVPTTVYSSPVSAGSSLFIHFWLTDIRDVYPLGVLWGTTGNTANANPSATASPAQIYQLPMDGAAIGGYPPAGNTTFPVLKNDRRLVTLFAANGEVVVNLLDTIPSTIATQPGEGFNVTDLNQPFYKAQLGQQEVK